MSQSIGFWEDTYTIETSSSVKQYYLVKEGTARGQVVISGTTGEKVLGPVQSHPAIGSTQFTAGDVVSVRKGMGTSKFVAGGSITRGDRLASNADGTVITTVTDHHYVVAHASQDAATGEIFEGELKGYTLSI